MIAVMHRPGNGEALGQKPLPNHMAGDLVFESIHAFVEIPGSPVGSFTFGLSIIPVSAGKGAHQQPAFTGHRIPATRLVCLPVRSYVGREIIAPKGYQSRTGLFRRQNPRERHLECPALTEYLVYLATRP